MTLKPIILLSSLAIILFGCSLNQTDLKVEINAASGNPVFESSVETQNLEDGSELLTLTITNKGLETELISSIAGTSSFSFGAHSSKTLKSVFWIIMSPKFA